MEFVAEMINTVVNNISDETTLDGVRENVRDYCSKFPLYTELHD
jgi:glycine/serine hydroxymethyltransferase